MTISRRWVLPALASGALATPAAMAGPINDPYVPYPPYAPTWANAVARGAQDRAGDVINLKDFGAIGDGNSHPLSGISWLAGVNVAGWTLAQWQAVFPGATALTNELDWCALQTALSVAITQTAATIYIPSGTYLLNVAAPSYTVPTDSRLTIHGDGVNSTCLVVTTTGAGALNLVPAARCYLEVRSLSIASTVSDGGTALSFSAGGTSTVGSLPQRQAVFTDIWVGPFHSTNLDEGFSNGIFANNVWHPLFRNCFVLQSAGNTTAIQVGIAANYSYGPEFEWCQVHCTVSPNQGNIAYQHLNSNQQGGRMIGCQAVQFNYGLQVIINPASAGTGNPDFSATHCHFNSYIANVVVDGRKFVNFNHNLMYTQSTTTFIDYDIRQVEAIYIKDNIYRGGNATIARKHVSLDVTNTVVPGGGLFFASVDEAMLYAATNVAPFYVGALGTSPNSTTIVLRLPAQAPGNDFAVYPTKLYSVIDASVASVIVITPESLIQPQHASPGTNPNYRLIKDDDLPTLGDRGPALYFSANDAALAQQDYGLIRVLCSSITAGAISSEMGIYAAQAGSLIQAMAITGQVVGTTVPTADNTLTRVIPTTGTTVVIAATCGCEILAPAGNLATLTITLPPNPANGQLIEVLMAAFSVTTSTFNTSDGSTIRNAPTTLAADTSVMWRYSAGQTTWYRLI